jgi:hypothetical protein
MHVGLMVLPTTCYEHDLSTFNPLKINKIRKDNCYFYYRGYNKSFNNNISLENVLKI